MCTIKQYIMLFVWFAILRGFEFFPTLVYEDRQVRLRLDLSLRIFLCAVIFALFLHTPVKCHKIIT